MNDSLLCRRAAVTALMIAALLFAGSRATLAASNCDPKVLAAQAALALAKVAADKAMDDEVSNDMPSSVMDLTCFDQAAAFSAMNAGKIFSGDFSQNDGFKHVIDDALKSMESNFAPSIVATKKLYDSSANSVAAFTGSLESPAVPGSSPVKIGGKQIKAYNCDTMSRLWSSVNNAGVKMNVPYPTFSDLLGGATNPPNASASSTSPGAPGASYKNSWNSTESKGAFTNLAAAVGAVKTAVIPSFSVTSGGTPTPINTPCQVIQAAMPSGSVTCP